MRRRTMVILLAVATIVVLFSTFGSSSICRECAVQSFAIDFQLPLIPLTYWRRRKVEETPLSKLAAELKLCQFHSHSWELIQGGGNGITCALGNGNHLSRNARCQEVVQFLADTNRFCGKSEAERWFKTALNIRDSKAVGDWLQCEKYPSDGQDSAENYETWRQKADESWPVYLKYSHDQWPH